ncbi:hypothetical protein G7092_02090 [Mucilaginibacter sp. HC2]|uniref:hypothetical protein n=1 Tax=Mucilaginibacter inviolabilis TaxID=2714892 RepID=UPI0014089750|nr:hypothetical protein [Mucilaginibacter inviolabilis]NHA02565.1 hypothetical protein [Mucilaginibacter inviolabilis]
MKTINEDHELEFELQEVYLTSKQWLSDLAFLDEETHFLEEQLTATGDHLIPANSQRNLAVRLQNAKQIHSNIRTTLDNFVKRLEPLLLESAPVPDLKLLEDFIALQTAIQDALAILKGFKYALVEARRAA